MSNSLFLFFLSTNQQSNKYNFPSHTNSSQPNLNSIKQNQTFGYKFKLKSNYPYLQILSSQQYPPYQLILQQHMDQVFQLNTHLHFGATVHISHFTERTNFYFFSNGVSYRNMLAYSSNDQPTDVSKALFQIKPVIKFQSEDFLQGIVKERYESANPPQADEKKTKMFIDQFEFQLKQNTSYSSQQYRFPIKYNQNFMLQHVYSCKYLSYIKNEELNEFILQLSELPTRNSVFSLHACYNYQKDINTYIPFNSAAFLNMKIHEGLEIRDLFLNYKKDSVFQCWKIEQEQKVTIAVGLYQTAQEIQYKEICYGDTVWIFHLESGSFVKVKQTGNHLSDNYFMKKIKYSLGYVKGEFSEEKNNDAKQTVQLNAEDQQSKASPSQILLQKTQNETSAQKFGLWQIVYASEKGTTTSRKQHSDRFKGGRVKFDQQVRFFNIRYKQYLSVRKIKLGRNKFKFQLCTQKFQQQNTTFKIKSLTPNALYCTTEDLFVIQHVETQTYLTLQQDFKITDTFAYLQPSNEYKKEDNFKFTKIDFIQEWQNNCILSIIPFLSEGVEIFKRMGGDGMISKKQDVLLELLLQNMIELLGFSYDLTEGFQASQNKLGKMTYNHNMVQKLLKQQGVIQVLVNLLKAINLDVIESNRTDIRMSNMNMKKIKSKKAQEKQLEQFEQANNKALKQEEQFSQLKVKGTLKVLRGYTPDLNGQKKKSSINPKLLNNIINVAFKILRNCCKSNTQNALLLFTHLPTFVPFLSLGSYAQTFFIDSFVNGIILQKMTNQQFRMIVNQYIKIFKKTQEYSPQVFNLLINFILLDGKSITKNQVQIFKLFFEEFNPLIFQLQDVDGRFFITYNRYNYELGDFCRQMEQLTFTLAAQIKFFANLTFDRNYLCSKQIKEKFPLNTLLFYLKQSNLHPLIKQGFIHILTHAYLNERPRFKDKNHFIYSFYGIDSKEKFIQSLGIKYKRRKSEYMKDGYTYEMKQMQNMGISEQGQRQILSCVEDVDHISPQQLQQIKQWLKSELKNSIQENSLDRKNTWQSGSKQLSQSTANNITTESLLMCLKYTIELNIFSSKQSEYIETLLNAFIKKISNSLQLTTQTTVTLQSTNFKQLLLQMVQKNVIKRYDLATRFDGVQDEITPDNICSIYVNYAFYQNILLLEKSHKRRKQYDKVIMEILELIEIYNSIIIQDKLINFLCQVIENQKFYLYQQGKKQFINQIIINKTLQESLVKRQNTFQLLLLLFYNSNTYNINWKTISLFVKEIFTQNQFLESLSRIVFICDQDQHQTFTKLMGLYKQIKLLIQTSQVWLSNNYDSPSYKYNSIILYFIDKIKSVIKLTVKGYKKDVHHHGGTFNVFDSIIGLQPNIIRQQQIILNNLDLDSEIIDFIQNYLHIIKNITHVTQKNLMIVTLFRTCFLFLYVYIYNCSENKKKLKNVICEAIGDISTFFTSIGNVDYGQLRLLVEYLKDNYEESIEFFMKNAQRLQKNNTYTWTHGQLILVMLKYHNQSVLANLKKFFLSIFDYTSFKQFLWLKKQTSQLCLDIRYFQSTPYEPIFYHIKMIQALLYLSSNLMQSTNTIKSHIRKSLSEGYLYSLLADDDYYTKENSIKTLLKVKVIFKARVLKLIQLVYLYEDKADVNLAMKLLRKYFEMVQIWIQEAPARQETQDYRKVIPLREIKADPQTATDQRITQIYNSTYKNQFLLQIYIQSIQNFCKCILKNQALSQLHQIAQSIVHRVFYLNQILHRVYHHRRQVYYPLPNEHNFNILIPKHKPQYNRKKYLLSLLLETQYNQDVHGKIVKNQTKMIQTFIKALGNINLKPFLLLRKIAQYLEDAFEKLQNSANQEYDNLMMLIKMLIIWIRSLELSKANQLRMQIGKSQLIFPILNFFQVCTFDARNKKLFLICLEFLTELIGQDGNRFIQTIFNNYFTNKDDSINFFLRIKAILREIAFEEQATYQCKKLIDGMDVFKRQVRSERTAEFLVLNYLIALCKGSFRENQIFLSSLSNISNFKIMGGIWQILKLQNQKYPMHLVNNKNFPLIAQCFATVREMVEGPCVQNQNEFLKRQFFQTILKFFEFEINNEQLQMEGTLENKLNDMSEISLVWSKQLKEYINEEKITRQWMPSQVKYLCMSLISSLLAENVNEKSISILMTVDPRLLTREIDKVYERYKQLKLQYTQENLDYSESKQVILPLGFKLYEILMYYPKEKIPQQTQGVRFFREHSRVIQVLHHDLSVVYFPKPTIQISQAFRLQFLQKVDRTSINSKLRDLQNVQIQNRQSDFPYGYLFFSVIVTIAILDFVLLTEETLTFVQDFTFYSVFSSYLHFITISNIKAVLMIAALIMAAVFFGLEIYGAVYMKDAVSKILESDATRWQKTMAVAKLFWNNLSYLYYFFAFIILIFSVYNPFFDAIILVAQLFKRNQTFSIILRAITQTLDQLFITLLVLIIATYILTSIIYYYYGATVYPDVCTNLFFCFMFSMDMGFKQDAGMVANTNSDVESFVNAKFGDVVLNFVYLFIIKLIISEIIGAIIVDKFADMREQKQALQEDQDSFCFICGIERNTLDRQQDGFQHHKDNYHNVFSYMEFLIHLQNSKKSNLSGIERFVYEQKSKGKLSWFPINRSFHLEQKKKHQEQNHEQKEEITEAQIYEKLMKQIDNEINEINTNLTQMNQLVNIKLAKDKRRQ